MQALLGEVRDEKLVDHSSQSSPTTVLLDMSHCNVIDEKVESSRDASTSVERSSRIAIRRRRHRHLEVRETARHPRRGDTQRKEKI